MTAEHIKLLHRAARELDGKLVLTSYGEDPSTGKTIQPKVEQFDIGDWQGMSERALQWKAEPHRNVYAPLAVLKHGVNSRGKVADYLHVFGVVADFDDANAADYMNRLPIPPGMVLESSQGRFQCFYIFNRPVTTDEAKEIGKRLVAYSECDGCSSDPIHVWRVAGCLNWPNKKKVSEGRPAEAQPVKVAQAWCGSAINPDALLKELPPIEEPQKPVQPLTRPLIGDYPATTKDEVKDALSYIHPDLPYDEWIKVLAALKDAGYEDLAHNWSAESPQYDPAEVERKLASFKSGGIKIATVFHYAKQGGYKPAFSYPYPSDKSDKSDITPWEVPISLPSGLPAVNAFDAELLPEALRGFVTDIAERMQCPPDFPAVTVMVSLGTLIGRRCGIHPKRKDDWLAAPNLWGAIVGRPSLMKSPAIQQGMKPFDALIAEASKRHAKAMTDSAIEAEVYAGKKDAWKLALRKAAKDGKPTDGMLPPVKPDAPIERRLRTNAGSVECLINLLNENPDGLMVFRDELTGWLRNLDKPGKEGDRQFFLEAWNGNGSGFDYDTFTHGHLHCEGLCLSILGSIQPGPLSHMIADAAKGGGGDDGMIQRFQLLVYPDSPGKWCNIDRWPDTEAKARVRRIFERLDEMIFPATDEGIPAIRFDNEAQNLFNEWRTELETKVQDETSPMIEAHLAKYRSLMPSLALLIHLAEVADREATLTPVTVDAAARAAAWCDYLESHARRIYGMKAMAEVEGARTLLAKLLRGDIQSPFTARQVYRNHWSRLTSPAEVEAACGILDDHGWLKAEEVRGETGRPTVTYTMNPKAAKKPAGGLPTQVSKVPEPPFDTFGTALPSPLTVEKQVVTA